MDNMITILLSSVAGLIVGIIIMVVLSNMGLNKSKREAEMTLKEAQNDADVIRKQAEIDARTTVHDMKLNADKEINARKEELNELENQLVRREDNLNFKQEALTSKEAQVDKTTARLNNKLAAIEEKEKVLDSKIGAQTQELERVAQLSQKEAKAELMDIVEKRTEKEMLQYIKDREDEAKSIADEKARNIIALSIQRLSQEESIDRTVSIVTLPSEEMKGRIIGREGRNIKAIEQATGVDLNIDDTPEVIEVSCFDPIRREIARISLEMLIKDGRIQPGRIEEVVNRVKNEMNATIMKTGEDVIFKLGLGKMDREIVKLVGRLKYRYSYGQNALEHSMEVAHLTGMMAAELGLNQTLAKRAGLLHDIGKAVDYEVDGSHVDLGYRLCKKHGEDEVVLNAIQSHHGDVEAKYIISNLVAAADTLSAARPGARHESMQNYINRLEQLEGIAKGFEGVESTYAIQAGREIRVMVKPDKVDDLTATKLARQIREKIENDMTYPGQIKVTVIREVRVNEVAK